MSKPICDQCEKAGISYRVYEPSGYVVTAMAIAPGYWDENGKYHRPIDPNKATATYSCNNGHSWSVTR